MRSRSRGPVVRGGRVCGVGSECDVGVDEVAADGVGERGADDDVDVVDGLRRERATVSAVGGEQ